MYNHTHTPDLRVGAVVLLQLTGRGELSAAGLAGKNPGSGEFSPVFLQVQGELILQHELITALRAQQILTHSKHTQSYPITYCAQTKNRTNFTGYLLEFPHDINEHCDKATFWTWNCLTSSFSCTMM